MRLTDTQRELLEHALDTMAAHAMTGTRPSHREIRAYEHAIALVRDIPDGHRRIRSDFNERRRTAQSELPIE